MDSRSANEYELMALAGVEAVLVPCPFTGERRTSAASFLGRFERILGLERKRAAAFGIELYAALSIHAGDVADFDAAFEALEALPELLRGERVCALGELALKSYSAREVELFVRQLVMAQQAGLPAMVEAPPGGDPRAMVAVLRDAFAGHDLDPANVVVVDVGLDKLEAFHALGLGAYGVPVSPRLSGLFVVHQKADADEARAILERYGPERLMFNSALHFGFGDPLGLARVLLHLSRQGVSAESLERLAFRNAFEFFGRSGKLAESLRPC
jgi:hypothetical protein